MCSSNRYEVCIRPSPNQDFQSRVTMTSMQSISFRFLAPQIADAIYAKYFNGKRKLEMRAMEFINRVNGTMVCLSCAILCHQLRTYRPRVYQDLPDFNYDPVGGWRPSMSPPSLVFVLMTNESCKTFSYGRRTPGRLYQGQPLQLRLRNLHQMITDWIQQNHCMSRKVVTALLTIMTQFILNWRVSYPSVRYPPRIHEELLCGTRHRSTIMPGV